MRPAYGLLFILYWLKFTAKKDIIGDHEGSRTLPAVASRVLLVALAFFGFMYYSFVCTLAVTDTDGMNNCKISRFVVSHRTVLWAVLYSYKYLVIQPRCWYM